MKPPAMQPHRSQQYRGWVSPTLQIPEKLLEASGSEIGLPDAELLSRSRARTIWMAPLNVGGSPEDCFVCVFRNQSLSRAVRRTYALHALRLSKRLHHNGFGTFHVLAALKRRGELLNWNSLLIARKISRVSELPSTGSHEFPVHPIASFTDPLAAELADSVARFHDQGFVHGDLKSRHVLVPQPYGSNGHALYFVDLEKTKELGYAPAVVRDIFAARDLIQLFASLPARHEGRDLEVVKQQLLHRYLAGRTVSDSRRRRIERFVNRYRSGGTFAQGETLLRSLLKRLRPGAGERRLPPPALESLNGSGPPPSVAVSAQPEPEIRKEISTGQRIAP